MHDKKAYHSKNLSQYSEAILRCPDKKTCPNLANELNLKHDSIYRDLINSIDQPDSTASALQKLASKELFGNKKYLIFDDTQINKQYAHEIEGIDIGFDSSSKQATLGLKMVTALLTDTNIKIPIDTEPFISKQLAQDSYKSKTKIAIDIFKSVINLQEIDMVLADAHFATKTSINFFHSVDQQYLMKIPRNRIVSIDGKFGQLQEQLRLKRNQRSKCAKAFFKGIPCYFYVIKIKEGTTVYFISKDFINPKSIVEIYRIRWNIEMFHRTAKQKLGIGDCQMRAIEKQKQHVLSVMYAYAIADIYRHKLKLKNTEEAIKCIRITKPKDLLLPILLAGENLC